MRKVLIATVAAFLAACTPPAQDNADTAVSPVPPEIARAVEASMPGLTIVSGAADGEGEFEVTGTLDGQEYEIEPYTCMVKFIYNIKMATATFYILQVNQ